MLNLIRMDLRRLFHTKSFYLSIIIFILFSGYCVYSQAKGQVINLYPYTPNLYLEGELYSVVDYYLNTPLHYMFTFTLKNGLIIFGIFFISFIASDDQSGYIKNLYMMCENKYIIVLSKLCVATILSAIVSIISFILTSVIGSIYVSDFTMGSMGDTLLFMILAWLFMIAFISLLTCVYHLIKSKVPSIILSVLFPLGITLIFLSPVLQDFVKYSLSGVFIHLPMLYDANQTVFTLIMCLVYIVIYQGLSIIIFIKREV